MYTARKQQDVKLAKWANLFGILARGGGVRSGTPCILYGYAYRIAYAQRQTENWQRSGKSVAEPERLIAIERRALFSRHRLNSHQVRRIVVCRKCPYNIHSLYSSLPRTDCVYAMNIHCVTMTTLAPATAPTRLSAPSGLAVIL